MKGMCNVDMVYMYTGHFAAFSHYRRTLPQPAAAMEKFASPILYYIEFTDFQKPAENARILCNKNQNKTGQVNFAVAAAIKHSGVLCRQSAINSNFKYFTSPLPCGFHLCLPFKH